MHYVSGSGYLGSPSCKEGHPQYEKQVLFKHVRDNYPEKMFFEVLEVVESNDVKEIRIRETLWQKKFNATNSDSFINGILANATGISCKKLVAVKKGSEEVLFFNSIKECKDTLGIDNVGDCILGKRASAKNYLFLSYEEYLLHSENVIDYIHLKYQKKYSEFKTSISERRKQIKTLVNLENGQTISCYARETFYQIKELGWIKKFVYVTEDLDKDLTYIQYLRDNLGEFSENILNNLTICIYDAHNIEEDSFINVANRFGYRKLKLCLAGFTKTIDGTKFKIKQS